MKFLKWAGRTLLVVVGILLLPVVDNGLTLWKRFVDRKFHVDDCEAVFKWQPSQLSQPFR